MKKILIIPARRHIIESYCEYIIRYLGNEFYFEMGYPSVPEYYHSIKKNVWGGNTSPLMKNPDEFDLIYPHFATHWFLEPPEKYAHKIAVVLLEPRQVPRFPDKIAAWGVTCKPLEKEYPNAIPLRFGVDTEMFKAFPQVKLDNKIHIGFIGNVQTPRRYIKQLFIDPLKDLEGIKLDIYPTNWQKSRDDEIEGMGGQEMLDNIVGGDVWLSGLPNIYNRMDIYVRCDIDHGYQFSVLEAAACEVPVVCVDSGITRELSDAGGAILIDRGHGSFEKPNLNKIAKLIREKVILLRNDVDLRKEIGKRGRVFVEEHYTWNKYIDNWREFFKKGLKHV